MSLLDEAKQETAKTKYPACAIAALDDDLRAEIDEALADEEVTKAAVERALSNRGMRIKASTLRRHSRGDCSCEPR